MLATRAKEKERERDETGGRKIRSSFSHSKKQLPGRGSRGVERTDDGVLMVDRWSIKQGQRHVERKITKTRRSVGREE